MKYELRIGLVLGFLAFLWLCLEYVAGLHTKYLDLFMIVTNLVFLIPIFGISRALVVKKKVHNDGKLTFLQGVKTGVIISLVFAAIAAIGQFTYHQVINPSYFEFMIEKSIEEGMTQEGAVSFFNQSNFIRSVLVSYLMVGLLVTIIASLIIKSKNK